jgi:DNA helicase HerA-like ATPase
MYLLTKDEDELWIVYSPEEKIRLGDSLKIGDIVAQVVDMHFADLPGVLEHILRKSLVPKSETTEHVQPEIRNILDSLIDQKVAVAKIRGRILESDDALGKKTYKTGLGEFEISRAKSEIKILSQDDLFEALSLQPSAQADFAKTLSTTPKDYDMPAEKLGINLITGMKGSGKSYSAKRLLLKLIERGVLTLVFDINGEYLNLWKRNENTPNEYAQCMRVLTPYIRTPRGCEVPLFIPLNEISYDEFASHLNVAQGTPSYQCLMQFWKQRAGKQFDLNDLQAYVSDPGNVSNEAVQMALQGRVDSAKASGLFGPSALTELIKDLHKSGGAIIINLSRVDRWERGIIVEFVLRKLSDLGESKAIRAVSLFLEEAQLYVEAKNIVNVLTRMRHVGVFPTFITNDPRTLPDEAFTLLDNVLVFMFRNEEELKHLAKTGLIDLKSLDALKNLEPKQCLAVGGITSNYPLFLEVNAQSGVVMGGESRRLVP